ncbi:hypothetical protein [Haloarcula argentinensis]|uniref:Uncharacterized protein n=1 Tax=Haloarcula argentinensis TaxID=43776 RepID=A0A830FBP5_HALAR|nr:hypothetical protein [Haloarcula argentinensis]MDS0252428.1 hypothetical protein [Haloarcula argentinensis]GGM32370.1 hypothetical protein GCM10009006_12410 [Haloarcula argentinensis]
MTREQWRGSERAKRVRTAKHERRSREQGEPERSEGSPDFRAVSGNEREESEGRDYRERSSNCERSGTFDPAGSRAVPPPDDGERADSRAVARFAHA